MRARSINVHVLHVKLEHYRLMFDRVPSQYHIYTWSIVISHWIMQYRCIKYVKEQRSCYSFRWERETPQYYIGTTNYTVFHVNEEHHSITCGRGTSYVFRLHEEHNSITYERATLHN